MIRLYRSGCVACEAVEVDVTSGWEMPADTLWIDLIEPSHGEDLAVERALGIAIPTRAEMSELEASSRLYRQNGATYVTADILHRGDDDLPAIDPVTFVLTQGPMVTIRYFDPRPFSLFVEKLAQDPSLCRTGTDMFLNLMEAIVDRASDVLSGLTGKIEGVGTHVFTEGRTVGFKHLIVKLGRAHMANARIEQSLAGLSRIFTFVGLDDGFEHSEEPREHLRSLGRDAASLISHNQAVAAGINFQLSAALGLINIEQSSIFKIFSIFTAVLMPPTLIGAVYGMNFEHMPELRWMGGYPLALGLMIISAVVPLLYFRRRGWI